MSSTNLTGGWAPPCIYEAVDEGALREHARCVDMPGDDIVPIDASVVVCLDPS
jgi:hypothetical protein